MKNWLGWHCFHIYKRVRFYGLWIHYVGPFYFTTKRRRKNTEAQAESTAKEHGNRGTVDSDSMPMAQGYRQVGASAPASTKTKEAM